MPSIAYFFPGLDDVGQAAACAGVEAGVLPCLGASRWVWGGCAPIPRSWSWSLPPSAPPSTALLGRPWASGKELCSWFRQAEVALLQATCRLRHPQEKGGWNPSPAFGLVQRRYYDNREIVIGPGLCLHARAAAGSDYAATMFCSINIMSSLNLY